MSHVARVVLWAVLLGIAGRFLGYVPAFRATANAFLDSTRDERVARLDPFVDPGGATDTKLSIGRRVDGIPRYVSSLNVNLLREAWIPTAVVAALILALPIPWRGRWGPLAIAVGVTQALAALRVTVAVLYGFSRVGYGESRLLDVGPLGSMVLHRADQILTGDLHLTYVFPLLVAFVLALRAGAVHVTWFETKRVHA